MKWIRKAVSWKTLHDLRKSSMSKTLKIRLLQATVESVLLYGCEAWTLTSTLEKSSDDYYTRMLREVQRVSWREM